MEIESVIVVWDGEGKFFQTWTSKFKEGDGIEHGKRIAELISGAYIIIPNTGDKNMIVNFYDHQKMKLDSGEEISVSEVIEGFKQISEEDEVFAFLEELRKTGKINMLGAIPYIQREFGFDEEKSHEYLKAWINEW